MRMLGARIAARGQGGFALMATLAIWVGVSGVTMIALLNMTLSSTIIAARQAENAGASRAADSAMETAVNQIATDPTGRIAALDPSGVNGCAQGLGAKGEGLTYRVDGNSVRVVATCQEIKDSSTAHLVRLTALSNDGSDGSKSAEREVPSDGSKSAERVVGSAVLRVNTERSKLGINGVRVEQWTVRDDDPDVTPPTTSTSTTTASTTTTTTPTTTTTTTPQDPATWSMTITSDWWWGYCASVDVTNTTRDKLAWRVRLPVDGWIYTIWNGQYTAANRSVTVTGADWNRVIGPRETTNFGFCAIR